MRRMGRMRDAGAVRTFLAVVAASVGVGICAYQQHFVLELNVSSWMEMLHHRCGLVMVAASVWMAVEVVIGSLVRAGRPATS